MDSDVRTSVFSQLVFAAVGVKPSMEEIAAWKSLLDDPQWNADIYRRPDGSIVLDVRPNFGLLMALDTRLSWGEFQGMVAHSWGQSIQVTATARLVALAHTVMEPLKLYVGNAEPAKAPDRKGWWW